MSDEGYRSSRPRARMRSVRSGLRTSAVAVLSCLAIVPIAGGSVAAESSATPRAWTDASIAGRVEIGGGRAMYLECSGIGSPTVVLVSGLRSSAWEWHTTGTAAESPALAVFEAVARSQRVCAYDRPGTVVDDGISRSDPTAQPTDAATAAADLHATLHAGGEPGPFVLVGHSIGGTIVRIFAASYPDEVAGMVLVDATSEFLQDAETSGEWAIQRRLMRVDAEAIPDSLIEYPDIERFDIDATFAQLRDAPRLSPMPLVVLSADELLGPSFPESIASGAVPADVPPGFGQVFDVASAEAQAQLARLVPGAVHVTDTDSGHEIHLIRPERVVWAIDQVLAAIGMGSLDASSRRQVELPDGRLMYLDCRGSGSPTVLLESGYHDSSDLWGETDAVSPVPAGDAFSGLAAITRVCRYDRPGTLRYSSDRVALTERSTAVTMPRTAADVVDDLHELLDRSGERRPIVLVAHSLGGLFARLYAQTYPEEVSGMVFVDSFPIEIPALFGDKWAAYSAVLDAAGSQSDPAFERIDVEASVAEIGRATPLDPDLPMLVLTKAEPFGGLPSTLEGFTATDLEDAWTEGAQALVELGNQTPQWIATGSDHYIQVHQPDLIVAATGVVIGRVANGESE